VSSVAHNYLNPQEPESRETDSLVTRYAYDPRRAAQLIEELGYRRAADGGFRDAGGQPLNVEIRANTQLDIPPKAALAIADYWGRAGVKTETFMMPTQMLRDLERVTTFPGFLVAQNPDDKGYMENFHSGNTPLAENSYTGQNKPRYNNPEFDALLDRYAVTIPRRERGEVLGRIVAHISDQLPLMGLFYNVEPTMVNNRLLNVFARTQETGQGRNVHEWDIRL
jgi:ABC-type transport system substrate-binding protein